MQHLLHLPGLLQYLLQYFLKYFLLLGLLLLHLLHLLLQGLRGNYYDQIRCF